MENILGDFIHFRVHTDELDINDLMSFLHEQADIQFAVKEYGKSNREHIHSCIRLKVPKQTFVDRMKKRFPVIKGNKYYGMEKLKKGYDTNARYCYKGTPNDWPDILYTIHSTEQWREYYNQYWAEWQKIHPPAEQITVTKTKVKTKTFMEKLCDKVFDEHPGLPNAIWRHYGWKTDQLNPPDLEELTKYQDYLAEILYLNLGLAVKNIDDMIFERLYRSLYGAILVRCPDKTIYKSEPKKLLDKFRSKL